MLRAPVTTMSTISLSISRNLSFLFSTNTRLHLFHLPTSANLSYTYEKFIPSHLLHSQYQLSHVSPLRASTSENIEPSSNNQSGKEEEEARESVSEILQEFGVSKKESIEIASKSPRYAKMLIDSVRELDELSLWSSWRGKNQSEEMEGSLSFKLKVYYMAKEKGDNGKVALLESVGLSFLLAMNVARYLSRETLPGLILKIKYLKEILSSTCNDNDDLVGKKARLMLMHLSIPIDDDLQQILSFFEKIEAKRGGLNMLGSKDVAFQYLVESFPRILSLSVESRMKPLVDYLEVIGVAKGKLRNILLLFAPIIFYDVEKDLKPRMHAFQKIGAAEDDFGRMLLKYPWILSAGIQKNYEDILSFFELQKVPKLSVDRAIKSWPFLLGCSTSKLNLMVGQLSELGVQNKKLGQVIATSPQLLLRKPQDFLKVISFFEDLGFDTESINQILARCPELFATSLEKTLKKKLDFLTSIGISKDHLPRVIKKYPELFVSDIDRALLPRINFLIKRGFSKRDVAFMIRRFSPILGYSIESVLRPKLDFLMNETEKSVKDVVEYPRYFSYSLEKKIKPRFWVLKRRKIQCSLKDMLAKNDDEFSVEFMGIERMLVPPELPQSQ